MIELRVMQKGNGLIGMLITDEDGKKYFGACMPVVGTPLMTIAPCVEEKQLNETTKIVTPSIIVLTNPNPVPNRIKYVAAHGCTEIGLPVLITSTADFAYILN